MSHLWSTLRVGTWTEREQVATWLQRAYPFKVVIDTQRDGERPSNAPQFSALQDTLANTSQWHELTISSFPPDNLAGQLEFHTAGPMNVLKVLHVAAGCVDSPSFTHLLELVPTEAPLSELRLYSSFASTHFLQLHWFPVLENLIVLIVNGRGVHEPFGLLPAFTQLQIFEADHLPLPEYELNANLPLLYTLQKLRLRASSVQWMAGREFPYLEDCAILLPHHWVAVQQHGVQLPSCRKLTYHGHPMTTVKSLHVPQMKEMELRSLDCNEQRVHRQLYFLRQLDGSISKLTALHLVLQCSEQVFFKMLRYFGPLEELVLSTAHPSPSWECSLRLLAAEPSTTDWPGLWRTHELWDRWHSSQIWHANVLTHLKYLGIQCLKGFSKSECIANCPLYRHVAWTRAQLRPHLEHLTVWESGDTVVDYASSGYLKKHLSPLNNKYDSMIIRGMVTQCLVIKQSDLQLLHLTSLFRQLQYLCIYAGPDDEICILPDLEQIKELKIEGGIIPAYSLDIDLPLDHTLQKLEVSSLAVFWMHGRTFKALDECIFTNLTRGPEDISAYKELQVDLPVCRRLVFTDHYEAPYCFISCPNVQVLEWYQFSQKFTFFGAAHKSLHDFLLNSSCLQRLHIGIPHYSGLDSLMQFIFQDSLGQRVWKNIRNVEMYIDFGPYETGESFLNQMVGDQQHYGKGWKEFAATRFDVFAYTVNLLARM